MNLFERAKKITLSSDYVLKFGRYKNMRLRDVYQFDNEYFLFLESIDKPELSEEIEKLRNKLL